MRLIFFGVLAICFIVLPLTMAYAQSESSPVRQHELRTIIETGIKQSPLLKKIIAQTSKSEAEKNQVEDLRVLPELKMNLRGGIVPDAKGDVFHSDHKQTDLDEWGPFVQTEFSFVQPLYTFGRLKNAENMAESGINIRESLNEMELDELKSIITQSYWTTIILTKGNKIARDVNENFHKLIDEINKEMENESSDLDDADVLEIKSNAYMVEQLLISGNSNFLIAKNLFTEITGIDSVITEEIADIEFDASQTALDRAVSTSLEQRNDLRALSFGIKALESKLNYKKSESLPLLYLAGGVQYAWAPNRSDQLNPFVYDNFNYINLGAFLGMSWDLSFLSSPHKSEADKYELQVQIENKNLLVSKIKIEVSEAFHKCAEKEKLLNRIKESIASSESWLLLSMDNWKMGFGEASKLIRAYKTYYELKSQELELMLEYHKSLADLAKKTSSFNKYLEWLDEGQVIF